MFDCVHFLTFGQEQEKLTFIRCIGKENQNRFKSVVLDSRPHPSGLPENLLFLLLITWISSSLLHSESTLPDPAHFLFAVKYMVLYFRQNSPTSIHTTLLGQWTYSTRAVHARSGRSSCTHLTYSSRNGLIPRSQWRYSTLTVDVLHARSSSIIV